ncbi:MAG: putative porin [Candidatus Omnitrophica bacterium]|jgi:hypothetical protein|nr:putative porin [Candidatus Omnitrophota bacterium]MDD5440620.1 putative porin [Candidatus Omnitrophota bacterium]
MRKNIVLLMIALMLAGYQLPVAAGEVDILVNKLVEKDILTPVEAQIILDETKTEVAKQIAEGKSSTLPAWVQNVKLKGDFRLRYQAEDKKSGADRHRGRIRYRLGVESKVNKKLKVAAGFASGGADPRSTNQTLENSFDTGDIRLDYAYAEWMSAPWATVKAGKIAGIKNLIFRPTDLLWDSDINPEGVTVQLTKSANSDLGLFLNSSVWILDESSSDKSDPFMGVIQPGVEYNFGSLGLIGDVKVKLACAYYWFQGVKGSTLDYSAGTNTLDGSVLKYEYDTISPAIEVKFSEPFNGVVPMFALFAESVHNPDPANNNNGWAAGLKFGDSKIGKWGDWQAGYLYRRLEKDAWLDAFPDSDAYSGGTGVKGHEITFEYGLSEHTSLGFDWYQMKQIEGAGENNVFQIDWQLKF